MWVCLSLRPLPPEERLDPRPAVGFLRPLLQRGKLTAEKIKQGLSSRAFPRRVPAAGVQLRLDADGEFLDEWPDGFFEESYREMFAH